ncbi:MAG TPA: class I SAM-dependent methyltransferase [Terracidiphilus sp.]|nr:class I SAM-dependent methyltransferase [Terracidiphilus sp.]
MCERAIAGPPFLKAMNAQEHWERIYSTKASDQVSWYAPHLNLSIELIERTSVPRTAAIIDVGGGESTLVDDLLARGYEDVSVLDISQTAIDANMRRLGKDAERVRWIAANVTEVELEPSRFDLWHDRAVFHFLTASSDRAAYVRQVTRAVKPGGHVIVSTFGPEGPTRCSGLDVVRYDSESLHNEFGSRFRLVESSTQLHHTPSGAMQQFLYCYLQTSTGGLT